MHHNHTQQSPATVTTPKTHLSHSHTTCLASTHQHNGPASYHTQQVRSRITISSSHHKPSTCRHKSFRGSIISQSHTAKKHDGAWGPSSPGARWELDISLLQSLLQIRLWIKLAPAFCLSFPYH